VGLLALGAGAGVGTGTMIAGGGALIMAEEGIIMGTTALTLVGLTATEWTVVGIITGVSGTTLATILGITKEEADKI